MTNPPVAMRINVYPDAERLNAAAAGLITDLVKAKPACVLGLATGGTPVGIYSEIRKTYQQGIVSFAQASSFNLDEYVGLASSHSQTYRTYMNDNLFHAIDIPLERTHVPDGCAADLAAECQRYDRMLEDAGHIDLQLLGLGHNGHIGFNEPYHELQGGTHMVELKPETRAANARFFASEDEVPTHAITMGISSIMKAKQILLVVKGADKADIVREALTGPITTECPASLLQAHPNLIVMLDEAAASLLQAQP